MGLFDRVERGLERAVNGTFAKVFRSELQPVEIASAIRRRMDDRATRSGTGRTMVPNLFTVELNPTDYDRLAEFEASLSEELLAEMQAHAETQRYTPGGPLSVQFAEIDELSTGTFRLTSATSRRVAAGGQAGQSSQPAPRPAAGGINQPRPVPPEAFDPASAPGASLEPAPWEVPAAGAAGAAGIAGAAAAGAGATASAGAAAGTAAGQVGAAAAGMPGAVIPDQQPARVSFNPSGQDPFADLPAGPAPHAPVHRDPALYSPPPSTAGAIARPWLDLDGERYPLIGAITVLGREESCDVLLEDSGVSRRHCEFRVTTDGPHIVCSVRDLGSTNGTFVNSERVTSQRLEPGDVVTVGRTSFTYRAGRR